MDFKDLFLLNSTKWLLEKKLQQKTQYRYIFLFPHLLLMLCFVLLLVSILGTKNMWWLVPLCQRSLCLSGEGRTRKNNIISNVLLKKGLWAL